MTDEVLLKTNDVSYRFGNKPPACDRINIQIKKGEVVALLGPNGAGKTTLLSLIGGLRVPQQGRIEIMGGDPSKPEVRRHLGVTPQDSSFPKTVRVREVIEFVLAQYQVSLKEDVVLALGLNKIWDRLLGGLSGGERRRLGLACALCSEAELVILDEPTAGLDLESRFAFFEYLKVMAREQGRAILFSTHHLDEVDQLADRVIVLHRGRVIREGRVDEIKAQFGYRRVRFSSSSLPQTPSHWRIASELDRHEIVTQEPESVVKWLFDASINFAGLEVQPIALDEIFLNMMRPS